MATVLTRTYLVMIILHASLICNSYSFPIISQATKFLEALNPLRKDLGVWNENSYRLTHQRVELHSMPGNFQQYHQISLLHDFLEQSILYCGHHRCVWGDAVYDDAEDACLCPWGPVSLLESEDAKIRDHRDSSCAEQIGCRFPHRPVFDPAVRSCACSIIPYPILTPDLLRKRLRPCKNDFEARAAELDRLVLEGTGDVDYLCLNNAAVNSIATRFATTSSFRRRQEDDPLGAIPLPPLPVFVPPPKTDVTPSLIEQSLSIQPQRNAIVHSIVPYFADGVITFHVQLDGPVPQTLLLNATDSMPCDRIGTQPDPSLILVPRNVYHGYQENTIPNCLIIAVNKYNASWINYWVQKTDGSGAIFSLLGDAKVHDIDQLDPSKPAALQVQVSSADSSIKGITIASPDVPRIKRYQVSRTQTHNDAIILPRGVEGLNPYTAIMSAEACSAIKCINNNDSAALFNPFTRTCWCSAPTYIDINPSAHGSA